LARIMQRILQRAKRGEPIRRVWQPQQEAAGLLMLPGCSLWSHASASWTMAFANLISVHSSA